MRTDLTVRAGRLISLATIIASSGFATLSSLAQHAPKSAAADRVDLAAGFRNPPASARPHTWWHWMNGNVSKPGITADLEAMKRIGIGGAQIFNVDVGIPDGKVPMMSDQWKDAMQFAIKEAKRLGLDLCIHNGAGWSSSGGPWIKPEQGMQFLTWSETSFSGPGRFEGKLPQPASREGFYRDIAVYAVRKPSASIDLKIANIRAKAAFERADHLSPSDAATPENSATPPSGVVILPASLADGSASWNAPAGDWTIVRMGYTPTGETNHPAPASGRGLEVDKLSRAALDTHWDGMMGPIVKGAGAIGKVGLNNCLIDSYEVGTQNWSPQFREEFLKRRGYDPLPYLPVITGRVIDSIEVSERFLWDMRRTICDLFADNYYGYLAEVCHKNGIKFSTEPYGNGEFDNLQIGGTADIPMGEFWIGGAAIETTKLAASAGHIYGKPIIGAESFTADTPNARWTIDPYAMKALGDRVFSLGVNRYIFHRYAHQPWLDLKPGMTMGPWGTNLERTVTWWEQGAEWMSYIARCQYLLQAGNFVADFAYFTGDDGPNDLPMLKGNLVPEGYDYDGIDAGSLQKLEVRNGRLTLPSGMTYRVLILPESRWMTPKSARKIRELVSAGATIYGARPLKSPSLQGYPSCDTEVAKISSMVWGDIDGNKVTSHVYGKGRICWQTAAPRLQTLVKTPDCQLVRGRPKAMVWIHRRTAGADIYFVANQRYQPETFTVAFRVSGKTPELFYPQSGITAAAPVWRSEGGTTLVTLPLSSAESVFVVFKNSAKKEHIESVVYVGKGQKTDERQVIKIVSARYEAVDGAGGADVSEKIAAMVAAGATTIEATNTNFGDPTSLHVKQLHVVYTLNGKRIEKTVGENQEIALIGDGSDTARPNYEYVQNSAGTGILAWMGGQFKLHYAGSGSVTGLSMEGIHASAPKVQPLAGPWRVTFPPKLGAPASINLKKLISWTDSDDSGVKYFSGSATYETDISVPSTMMVKDNALYLDLGTVKNFAEVWLNGVSLGTLWKPPFRLDVTNKIKPGHNVLKVRVTNLWPNRIIGDERYPSDVEWNGEVIKAWPDWLLQGKKRPASPRVTWTTWRVFTKDSPLYRSGLIGPAELISVARIPLY